MGCGYVDRDCLTTSFMGVAVSEVVLRQVILTKTKVQWNLKKFVQPAMFGQCF